MQYRLKRNQWIYYTTFLCSLAQRCSAMLHKDSSHDPSLRLGPVKIGRYDSSPTHDSSPAFTASLGHRYEAPNAQPQLETPRPKAIKAVHKADHMEELRKAEEKIGQLGLVPRRSMDGTHGPWANMAGAFVLVPRSC